MAGTGVAAGFRSEAVRPLKHRAEAARGQCSLASNDPERMTNNYRLPQEGVEEQELRRMLARARGDDADWRGGRLWSLVYYAGRSHTDFLCEVFREYASENGLSPSAFPSLARFQREVVSMLRTLLGGGDEVVGAMTSGGTESILLAVKAYRDQARAQGRTGGRLEMIVPSTAHPAFLKAAQYFDLVPVAIPVASDYRADVAAMARAVTPRTVLLVASAPCFPFGKVDPVEELGALAAERGVGLHVDACVGAFILPFLRERAAQLPAFDLSVPGVTSLSADLHKYGYALKGASAILYRSPGLRRGQFFVDTEWPGGLFGSPGMLGTRPGGVIAAAWAAMLRLGESGYRRLAHESMELAQRLQRGIEQIPGLRIVGEPDMTVFAFTSDELDIFAIADRMTARGWHVDRQNAPPSIHLVVTPNHRGAIAPFLQDLAHAAADPEVRATASRARRATLYGVTSIAEGADPHLSVIRGMEAALDRF
jgi:sphinganine-1-phosphate aldolase